MWPHVGFGIEAVGDRPVDAAAEAPQDEGAAGEGDRRLGEEARRRPRTATDRFVMLPARMKTLPIYFCKIKPIII